jgi:hypothetical protein
VFAVGFTHSTEIQNGAGQTAESLGFGNIGCSFEGSTNTEQMPKWNDQNRRFGIELTKPKDSHDRVNEGVNCCFFPSWVSRWGR